MSDTLASLRAEANNQKRGRPTPENLVLRAWSAAIESVRMRPISELVGCGDNSCIIVSPKGMATNGGCRCDAQRLRHAVLTLKARVRALEMATTPHPPTPETKACPETIRESSLEYADDDGPFIITVLRDYLQREIPTGRVAKIAIAVNRNEDRERALAWIEGRIPAGGKGAE